MALFSTEKAVANAVEAGDFDGQKAAIENFEKLLKQEELNIKDEYDLLNASAEKLATSTGKLLNSEPEEKDKRLEISGENYGQGTDQRHKVATQEHLMRAHQALFDDDVEYAKQMMDTAGVELSKRVEDLYTSLQSVRLQ